MIKWTFIILSIFILGLSITIAKSFYDQFDEWNYHWIAPWSLYNFYRIFTYSFEYLFRTQINLPAIQVLNDVNSITFASTIYALTKLGIPDVLHERELDVTEIADLVDANPEFLYRSMKSLSTRGYFREVRPKIFRNSPFTDILRENHKFSIKDLVVLPMDLQLSSLNNIYNNIKTGKNSFYETHKKDLYQYVKEKGMIKHFTNLMKQEDIWNPAIIIEMNITKCTQIIDLGSIGSGIFMKRILDSNPMLKGILFDSKEVIDQLKEEDWNYYSNRIEFQHGNYFESVPKGDCYMIKNILSSFDDQKALKLLKTIESKMNNHDKIFIIQMNMKENHPDYETSLFDLNMLFFLNGKVRNPKEIEHLIENTSLKVYSIQQTRSNFEILEIIKN